MIAKNSHNNKWLTENPLFKNKDQRYYYDFGTGIKIERDEVKKERDAFLNAASGSSTKPQKQKKDDFLEGFNDPYGENREKERKQKEQERKERLAKIRANADTRTWSSQNDPFLEGFNQDSTQHNALKEIKENRERKEELLQRLYAGQVMASTPFPANLLRIGVGRALEEHVREKHYGRNQYNVNLPKTESIAKKWNWEPEIADCHQNTAPKNEPHIKYVSPVDKHRENIFNNAGDKEITAAEDEPTYNYASPDWELEHFSLDILPWIRYGNEPEDSTTWYKRIGGALGLGR